MRRWAVRKAKVAKSTMCCFVCIRAVLPRPRDAWVYNSSPDKLVSNMTRHINYCNNQDPDNFQIDKTQATWNKELATALKKLPELIDLDKSKVRVALYRPFFRQYLYFDSTFVAAKYQIPHFYPNDDTKNLAILVSDKTKSKFSTIVTDNTPDLQNVTNGQCFPLRNQIC